MGLVRMGPIVLDLDDVRAIVNRNDPTQGGGASVEVTFRDGSKMQFEGEQAEALRRFVLNLPDGLPVVGANEAVMGTVGRREDLAPEERQERN